MNEILIIVGAYSMKFLFYEREIKHVFLENKYVCILVGHLLLTFCWKLIISLEVQFWETEILKSWINNRELHGNPNCFPCNYLNCLENVNG